MCQQKDKSWWTKKFVPPAIKKGLGTVVTFAKFVFICALSTFLQEIWFNGEMLFETFDIVIKNLSQTVLAGKTAEIIMKGGIEMIKNFRDYFKSQNQFKNKAKAASEWVR